MQYQNYLLDLERELKYRNYSPRTFEAYSKCITYFLKYIKNDISKISKETIIDFILHLESKNKAPKTINLYKESIKFFTKDILKINLDFDIKLSHEAKKLPIILSKEEIIQIIEVIKNTKHKLLISLSYSS
jgi:integrase/recombinase XerD